MADVSKLVDELSGLTVLEAAELARLLKEKWKPPKVSIADIKRDLPLWPDEVIELWLFHLANRKLGDAGWPPPEPLGDHPWAIRPTHDPLIWHSPLDTLSTGQGDCKDYAIAKYLALLEAGFPEEDVKLVIVYDLTVKQDHAIVMVRFKGDWIALDNRWLALVRDNELRHAIPLYVLDENGIGEFARQEAKVPAQTGFTN